MNVCVHLHAVTIVIAAKAVADTRAVTAAYSVCPSGPSMDGRARLDGRLGKIARLKPVFL